MRNPSEAVREHLRKLGMICFAILTGVVIFGGVVWYLLDSGAFSPLEGLPPYFATLFNLVAMVAILKAHFLPRFFQRPPLAPEAPEEAWLAWHNKTTIVGFALREGAAFIALVGVLLTGRQTGGFAMAGLAVLSMIMAWPRADQLDGI
jgi:hypothetical protein